MARVVALLTCNFKLEDEVNNCAPREPEDPFKAVELGYLFMPEVWGKGLATESVQAVVNVYRRDMEPVHRPLFSREMQANAHALNRVSRRVLEKAGFREVGRFDTEGLPSAGGRWRTGIHDCALSGGGLKRWASIIQVRAEVVASWRKESSS